MSRINITILLWEDIAGFSYFTSMCGKSIARIFEYLKNGERSYYNLVKFCKHTFDENETGFPNLISRHRKRKKKNITIRVAEYLYRFAIKAWLWFRSVLLQEKPVVCNGYSTYRCTVYFKRSSKSDVQKISRTHPSETLHFFLATNILRPHKQSLTF